MSACQLGLFSSHPCVIWITTSCDRSARSPRPRARMNASALHRRCSAGAIAPGSRAVACNAAALP